MNRDFLPVASIHGFIMFAVIDKPVAAFKYLDMVPDLSAIQSIFSPATKSAA